MTLKVNDPSDEVRAMSPKWDMVDSLIGGTWAMRNRAETYLQRWPKEELESYNYRLHSSTLFNALGRTIENMSSKPFTEPLRYTNIDPTVESWFDNIDLCGRNLDMFAYEVFRTGLSYGLTHILVDYPKTVADDGTPLAITLADEKAIGARPYLIHVEPSAVLGWISSKVQGVETLMQVRILEDVNVNDGAFGTTMIQQVRVLTPGAWQVYRKSTLGSQGGELWVLFNEGVTSLDYIPLVTFYTRRTGFMQAVPPLSDLADLNVQHWNSSSDQYSILHTARVPILAITGVSSDSDIKVVVGAKAALMLPLGADAKYVEHTGASIDAGRDSLKDLEEQMRTMGAELLVAQPGDMTATQSSIDTAQAQCQLSQMASALEDVLDQVIDTMSDWAGLGNQGDIDVFDDFAAAPIQGAAVQPFVAALSVLVASDLLSRESAFSELQRYGVLNPDLLWGTESEKIGAVTPALQGNPLALGDTKPGLPPVITPPLGA